MCMVEILCPHCAEEVEVEPENGSVFECPHCASDFQFDSTPTIEVDYSDKFWGLALDTSYPEHCLDYIAQVDGELPQNRLIEVSTNSLSSIGWVVCMLISVLAIPVVVIWIFSHVIKNSKSEYQHFFGVQRWRHYLDPSEKAIITITDYKNGSFPTQVAYLEGSLMISKTTGNLDSGPFYNLELNLKQRLCFGDKELAENCRENIRTALQ
jgi:hypothetical protein